MPSFTLEVITEMSIGGTGISDIEAEAPSGREQIGHCYWHRGGGPDPEDIDWDSRLWCAKSWQPNTSLQDGAWTSTRQAIEVAEWEWGTVNRMYETYNGQSFVSEDGSSGMPIIALNEQCLFYQEESGDTFPEGAYDVEFHELEHANRSLSGGMQICNS